MALFVGVDSTTIGQVLFVPVEVWMISWDTEYDLWSMNRESC